MDQTEKQMEFRKVIARINQGKNILLIAHKKPDGDVLGSVCAMDHVLKRVNKKHQAACVDKPPHNLEFLNCADKFIHEFDHNDYDLVITLDCGADYMTGYNEKYADLFKENKHKIINIDHHPSNEKFGGINIVDWTSASTTMIILEFLEFAKFKIDPIIATSLLTGIYTDTGSFMHSNTNSKVYKAASKLLSYGAQLSIIVKYAFKSMPVNTLQLWGRVLNTLKINNEGIAMGVATKQDFDETGTKSEHLTGLIDLLNSIPDTKFAVLLNEDEKGNVKGSFRTQSDNINLSDI